MRVAGCFLTCISLIVALGFIWLGYIMTFEGDGLLAGMENTPKEGWDYWMRKEFWRDFWWFAIYLTFSIMGVLLPLIATLRSRRPILERRTADWTLFVVSLIYTAAPLVLLVAWIRVASILTVIPLTFAFGGTFATVTFLLRARHPHAQLD